MDKLSELEFRSLCEKIYRHSFASSSERIHELIRRLLLTLVPSKLQAKEVLYQYTSLSGLKEMVTNGELWSTPLGYLNDASEYHYGRTQVSKFTDTVMAAPDVTLTSIHERVYTHVNSVLNIMDPNDVFVTCFTLNDDQLSQWRGYAMDGYGYAIGFDTARLKQAYPSSLMLNVLYDEHLQRQLVRTFMMNATTVISGIMNEQNKAIVEMFIDVSNWNDHFPSIYLGCGYHTLLPALKDSGFAEENEIRLSLNTSAYPELRKNLKFHDKRGMLVPHIPLTWDNNKLPIQEIIVGPNLDFDKARWSMDHFLRLHGYDNVEIRRSKIPYIA
jgi:Protein of unknown function (DUF2971)